MKILALITIGLGFGFPTFAAGEESAETLERHEEGSGKLADEQDELSADVQQLAIEQTVPKVIELLNEVEEIMAEATDWLAEANTGGETLAAQTEIIEKIYDASKERQQQQGGGQSGSAMMDMMERMMGKEPGKAPPGGQPGAGEGEGGAEGGQGAGGGTDSANEAIGGAAGEAAVTRTVPKAAGTAGRALPAEFRSALDAYNRGIGQQEK